MFGKNMGVDYVMLELRYVFTVYVVIQGLLYLMGQFSIWSFKIYPLVFVFLSLTWAERKPVGNQVSD